MTGPTEQGAESIQLHFCQRCGISIPVADLESGRAVPAPGGFLCAGCAYQRRDEELQAGPRVVRPTAKEGSSRALLGVAMLYVVGATTFLLVREINRKPQDLTLPPTLASTRDVQDVGKMLLAFEEDVREALAQLEGNDVQGAAAVAALQKTLGALERYVAGRFDEALARDGDIIEGVLKLTDRTVGLKRGIPEIQEQLRSIQRKLEGLGGRGDGPAVAEPPAPVPEVGGESKEEREKRRLAEEHVAKLSDRSAPDQARYNAAVQLGDLKHPIAVDPLIQALEKDSYDLVRRAAAWALGELGKEAVRAIPALIRQIGGKEEYVGYMCERALGDITKAALGAAKSFDFDPTMSLRERKKVQKKWEDWWEQNKDVLLK